MSNVPMETLLSSYLQSEDNYICRVDPTPNNNFFIQIQNRLQTTLHLIYLESSPPYRWHSVLEERSDVWINLHDLLTFLPLDGCHTSQPEESFHFIWGSERSGFMQLYLYEYNHATHTTTLVNPIGDHGEWVVDSIVAIDSKKSLVYYSGNREHPTEKHVYVSPLLSNAAAAADPSLVSKRRTVRLTQDVGWHQDVVINLQDNVMFGVHSSLCSPPTLFQTTLPSSPWPPEQQNSNLSQSTILFANLTSATVTLPLPFQTREYSASGLTTSIHSLLRARSLLSILRLPELHTVEHIHSGQRVQLQCSVLLPDPSRYGQGPHPCVVAVYGGPHVQRVANSWASPSPRPRLSSPFSSFRSKAGTAEMRAQRLADSGYVVLKCDNRGSSRRGLAFEGAIKHDMGHLEIVDQGAAVNYFASKGIVDPTRVGIYGWSYGVRPPSVSRLILTDPLPCLR
jgi:dipeptidyl-peptidase 4